MNKSLNVKRKPIMTVVSLTLTAGINLLAWSVLIWTSIAADPTTIFDHIPLVFATYLLLLVDLVGLVTVLAATWRNESRPRLRRIAYAVSLFSFPLYLLGIALIV